MKPTTAIATTTQLPPANREPKDIRELLSAESFKLKMAAALPKHMTAERMIRVASTALQKNSRLLSCTPQSFLLSMLDLSQAGLEPNGVHAALVPYGKECKAVIMYQGYVELMFRTNQIASVHAELICENDVFDYNIGEITRHKIDFRSPRGEPYAAYFMVRFKSGGVKFEVMTREQIESIRDGSQGYRAFIDGKISESPWQSDPGEMWKKTVCRRGAKWVPKSPELIAALNSDKTEDRQTIEVAASVVRPRQRAIAPATQAQLEPPRDQDDVPYDFPQEKPVDVPITLVAAKEAPAVTQDTEPDYYAGMEDYLTGAGISFEAFRKWLGMTKRVNDPDSLGGLPDVPQKVLKDLAADAKSLAALTKFAKGQQ